MAVRALVCDDDTPVRNMVRDLLEERGVEVIEAADGQEALAVFRKQRIDLLVTDFLMPKVDGLQVIRAVRSSGQREQMPVVLMSAISRSQLLGDQTSPGEVHYMNKPFRPKKMARLLDKVLNKLASSR